jgi:4-hydroxy-3-polyprenylbenzoate decarboxylase
LGHGQLSLAKYLWIVAGEDDPHLDLRDVAAFLRHVLLRVDWRRDLLFQTCTTIDTLDYTGGRLNEGSKLVIAAAGPPRRVLPGELDGRFTLPDGFRRPRIVLPGILAVECEAAAGRHRDAARHSERSEESRPAAGRHSERSEESLSATARHSERSEESRPSSDLNPILRRVQNGGSLAAFPLIVVVDDSQFAARTLDNFLWTTFTRSDPARDVYGIDSFCSDKHWGCRGPLVIDARTKPHHAPPLVEDPDIGRRVDALAAPGGPLHGLI